MNDVEHLKDLRAFLAVCQERNFTRAAARLGLTQSALSQTIRNLEERLGVRLFARTTRSVSMTDAGERLMNSVEAPMQAIAAGLGQIGELRDKPSGTIRLTADEFAVQYVLWPALKRFLPDYPEIRVEVSADQGLTDIVQSRFDAGVRRGGLVARDMVAVRISPDIRMALVGAPAYFRKRGKPARPQDLTAHQGINLRLPTHGEIFLWEFRKGTRSRRIRCDGMLVFNSLAPILDAALAGFGLAWLPDPMVRESVAAGRLVPVLEDWAQTYDGYHLYYPNRRHQPPAFALLVKALRSRGQADAQ
jgi:DNA-binding transcriptional LysR family regulator